MDNIKEQFKWLVIDSMNESQHTNSYVTYNLLLEFEKTLDKFINDNTSVKHVSKPIGKKRTRVINAKFI